MQVSLENAVKQHFVNHQEQLKEARDRAEAVNTKEMNLGDGQVAKILAATGYESTEDIIKNAVVVKKLKRAALIQVRDLLYYYNRWGVGTCLVPSIMPIGAFNAAWGPAIPMRIESTLLKRLGVTKRYADRGDYLHDYSECVVRKI